MLSEMGEPPVGEALNLALSGRGLGLLNFAALQAAGTDAHTPV